MLDAEIESAGAERMLRGIRDRLNSSQSLLSVLEDDLQQYESEAFASSGFGAWAPLNPATIAMKGNGRILVDSGGLLDELTSGSAAEISGETLTIRSRAPYAGFLKRGARGAPPRDPVPQPDRGDVSEWAQNMIRYAVDGRRR